MIKITKILKREKGNLFDVYFENDSKISIDSEIIYYHKLEVGKKVNLDELEELNSLALQKKAFSLALRYLTKQSKTEYQVRQYLFKKNYDENIIKVCINKLKYYNYINDYEYTKALIKFKSIGKPTGKKKLIYDLKMKGISDDIINKMDEFFPYGVEYQQAHKLIKLYMKKYSNLPEKLCMQKTFQAGNRRGFSWEILKKAYNDVSENREIDS